MSNANKETRHRKQQMRINNESPPSATTLKVPLPSSIAMAKESTTEMPRVDVLGYTGNSVDLSDYGVDAPVVYLINGIKEAKGKVPYLLNHSTNHVLGHVEKFSKSNQELRVQAIHSYPSQESREVAGAIANGLPYEASMGLEINLNTVTYHSEGQVEANGRVFNAPIYTVGESKLVEMSATLFGRDGDTEVTQLSKDTLMKIKNAAGSGTPTPEPITPPVTSPVVPPVAPVNNTSPTPPVTPPVTPPAPAPTPAPVHNGGVPGPSVLNAVKWMRKYNNHLELVEQALSEGWDDDRLAREVKVKEIENGYGSVPSPFMPNNTIENSFLARLANSVGISPEFIEKKLGKAAVDHALAQPLMGLAEGLMLCANSNGGRFNGHSDKINLAKHVKNLKVNNAFSTIDYPNLMHQVSKWKMEEAWMLDAPYAPTICKPESNKDFRPTGHIKPKGGTMWNGLNQEGKIEHGSFGKEDKYETRLSTVAQILTFKREDIINDDIGWIEETLNLMIEGAMMVPDYQLVNLIYNGLTAGVLTSGSTHRTLALTLANLETLYNTVKTRQVVKGDKSVKNRTDTKWKLVVTTGLEKTAWEIIKQDVFQLGPDTTLTGRDNYWKNKFDISEFAQLDNTTYHADAKVGAWGLLPVNPKYSPFAITYLNGQKRPTTETVDLPADELGFGVRGYWDVNLDYRPVENDELQATAWSFPT